jgi:hypothetical protein
MIPNSDKLAEGMEPSTEEGRQTTELSRQQTADSGQE